MNKYFYLALVVKSPQCLTQQPILVLSLGSVEVLGSTCQNALINSSLSLSCDAYVRSTVHTQLIDDMSAVYSLFSGGLF